MPRKRDPRRDKAFEIWKQQNGDISNREIANKLDVPEKTISAWKSRDKWNVVLQKKDRSTTNKKLSPKKQNIKVKEESLPSDELTEKQRLFCIHYVKTFNATQSAIKAGYSSDTAHVIGHENLRKPKIASYIKEIKGNMTDSLFLDAMDVLRKYATIAFADITDFVTFGKKEVQEMGMFGPLEDEEGNPLMKEVNYVDFKESNMVDGTIITEAKQGKDGVSIKLADKMKALEMLTKYFDMLPDNFKRKIAEEKLAIEKEKLAITKAKANIDDGDYEDDGFIEALGNAAAEVWSDDDSDDGSAETEET
ncbi:terminase [Ornithinibacillus sp. L9]|uniref:Terminase n=1 Tax=Ornithinibacillus caprae TaxID=2678566 RepID=A0A6N8FHJ5_9BACI|nr:terminase small subunit [Ornithinibacillus caprae]MUK89142.1 terminase [Ornithinibacillus caprae]